MSPDRAPSRRAVIQALDRRGFQAKARLGQNFLFDPQLLEALLEDACIEAGEPILEVGAGAGTLTRRLLARGCRVIAVEVDPVLQGYLADTLKDPRLTLISGDVLARKGALAHDVAEVLGRWGTPYRLVANLPYAIATPLVHVLMAGDPPLAGLGVLVQREVADRWAASPGGRDYGATSVVLSLFGDGRITRSVGRQLFTPPPRVDSAFYVWRAHGDLPPDHGPVLKVCRRLFLKRRKMLRSQLARWIAPQEPWWAEAGIDPRRRPEAVPAEPLWALARELVSRGFDSAMEGPR